MKSLAERHADRAQRKADNASERTGFTTNTAAEAIILAQNVADIVSGLDEVALAEFKTAMQDYDPTSSRSISEDEDGNSMAGIGVVNTKVVPAAAEGGNGGGTGGWVQQPEPTDFGGGNINGAALEAQTGDTSGSWGGEAKTDTKADAKTKAADAAAAKANEAK